MENSLDYLDLGKVEHALNFYIQSNLSLPSNGEYREVLKKVQSLYAQLAEEHDLDPTRATVGVVAH